MTAYEDVVEALEAQGLEARIEEPLEYRGGTPIEVLGDVIVHVPESPRTMSSS